MNQRPCDHCARADAGSCPSYPAPVGDCAQFCPSQGEIQRRWWDTLGDRKLFDGEVDGE